MKDVGVGGRTWGAGLSAAMIKSARVTEGEREETG